MGKYSVVLTAGAVVLLVLAATDAYRAQTLEPHVLKNVLATSTVATAAATSTTGRAASPVAKASVVTDPTRPTGAPYQDALVLGDGKYVTSGPKKGYIYLCHVATGGKGAQGSAPWIHGTTWIPSQKVSVEGSVSWPSATYNMTVAGNTRTITGNGLPTDHPTGIFPIQKSDPAYRYDGNPNSIKPQSYDFMLPVSPTILSTPQCIYNEVGIMNDGVALFDGFDAEYRDAVAHETQDAWEGHPDSAGVYHDHGYEKGYLNDSVSTVVGYAFDGFPITGGKLPSGNYVTSAELDECHGMTSPIMLDGKTVTMYHYVLTQDFPYSVSCFRGASHEPKPGVGGAAQTSTAAQSGPPQAAVEACGGKAQNAACSFSAPAGTKTGTCERTPMGTLACVPS